MWYFAWVLGLSMAVMFGVLNAMWLEIRLKSNNTKTERDQDL